MLHRANATPGGVRPMNSGEHFAPDSPRHQAGNHAWYCNADAIITNIRDGILAPKCSVDAGG